MRSWGNMGKRKGEKQMAQKSSGSPVLKIGDMASLDVAFSEFDFEELERSIKRFQTEPMIKRIFEKEQNLKKFIAQNENELSSVEEAAVVDTVASAEQLALLHREITTCENELSSFEEEIRSYRSQLMETHKEMRTLRGRTMTVAQQFTNRRDLGVRLAEIQQKLHIPDSLLNSISTGEINAQYMVNLRTLEQHITYIKEYGLLDSAVTRAEVWPKIEDAVNKVSTRLQVFISKRLQQLQVENTNIGLVQQAIASSCGFANFFVGQHSEAHYLTICAEYKETISRVYYAHFRTYLKDIQKVEEQNTAKGLKKPAMELIIPKDFFDVKKGKENTEKKFFSTDIFSQAATQVKLLGKKEFDVELKDRIYCLCAVEVIESQLFLDPSILEKGKHAFTWCDTVIQALVKVANQMATEKKFVSVFFTGGPSRTCDDVIEGAFARVMGMLGEVLRKGLEEYPNDICGALIVARGIDVISTYFTQHPEVSNAFMDASFKEWMELLKNRILHLLSVNLRTVKEINLVPLQPHRFHFKHTVVEAIASDSALAAQLVIHTVVQRYASFSGDIHFLNTLQVRHSRVPMPDMSLSPSQSGSEPLSPGSPPVTRRPIYEDYIQTSLRTILLEMRKCITSLARRHTNVMLQNIFYINNYSGIMDTWAEYGLPSDLPDTSEVAKAQSEVIEQFVLLEFQSSLFGKIYEFVQKYQPLVQIVREDVDPATMTAVFSANQEVVNSQEMQTLVIGFHKSWQQGLQQLHEAAGKYFSKANVATQVLRVFFVKILQSNLRMRSLALSCFSNPPFRSKLVSNQNLVHEMSGKYTMQLDEQ